MAREVVRRLGADRTHVADVDKTTEVVGFGKPYRTPWPGVRALCGVFLATGSVVMQSGSTIRCPACRHLSGGRAALGE